MNYKVKFTEAAIHDLREIKCYIHTTLQNTEAAQNTINGIRKEVNKLYLFPEKHPLVNDELLASLGFRMIHYRNYNAFYFIDEESKAVYIVRVLYMRMNWTEIFKL